MNQAPSQRLSPQQNQMLTPRLQQAVRLLQLSSADYAQELNALVASNPFLEMDEYATARLIGAGDFGRAATAAPPMTAASASASPEPDTGPGADGGSHGSGDHDHAGESAHEGRDESADWQAPGAKPRDGASASLADPMDFTAAEIHLREHLRSQAQLLPLSARDQALVGAVIESIDDDGYLRLPLAEMALMTDVVPPPDDCEMRTALKLVQSFEPVGVGARDIGECLLLQLENLAPASRSLAQRIITEHLQGLAQRDTAGIARRLGVARAEVEAAAAAIRRLDPRPGWRFSHADVHFVTPDVLVHKVRGQWVASLNAGVVPRLRLNQPIADLFQQHKGGMGSSAGKAHAGGHVELSAHLQDARWTLRNVEQRFSTILDVAQAIIRRQPAFFEYGPLAMKPLSLRQIAEEVGVHESTVCRVTNNKYMATPVGSLELKYFFSRPMPMGETFVCSATAIREVVRELIEAEHPSHPLSDVDIAEQLARQGMHIARRTVTKYRQALKLPPVDRRRALAAIG